jgi:hypothetical protein
LNYFNWTFQFSTSQCVVEVIEGQEK